MTETLATIYYTADLFTPDDSDTNVYGEPCEAGYGETMESGWYDPAFDTWTVFEEKDSVRPDTIEDDDDRFEDGWTLEDLISMDIGDRLGAIDNHDGYSWYASDPVMNYTTGERVMIAAHVELREQEHVCQWGPTELSVMAETPHRKCLTFWCDIITLDLERNER